MDELPLREAGRQRPLGDQRIAGVTLHADSFRVHRGRGKQMICGLRDETEALRVPIAGLRHASAWRGENGVRVEKLARERIRRIFVTKIRGLIQHLQAWETLEGVSMRRAWVVQASGIMVWAWRVAAIWDLRASHLTSRSPSSQKIAFCRSPRHITWWVALAYSMRTCLGMGGNLAPKRRIAKILLLTDPFPLPPNGICWRVLQSI